MNEKMTTKELEHDCIGANWHERIIYEDYWRGPGIWYLTTACGGKIEISYCPFCGEALWKLAQKDE